MSCPILANIQGQSGQGLEQPGGVEDVPAPGRGLCWLSPALPLPQATPVTLVQKVSPPSKSSFKLVLKIKNKNIKYCFVQESKPNAPFQLKEPLSMQNEAFL